MSGAGAVQGVPPSARVNAIGEAGWAPLGDQVVLGKDVLELLSTSMYVDPMTVYREYVQNAADAVDEARRAGLLFYFHKG